MLEFWQQAISKIWRSKWARSGTNKPTAASKRANAQLVAGSDITYEPGEVAHKGLNYKAKRNPSCLASSDFVGLGTNTGVAGKQVHLTGKISACWKGHEFFEPERFLRILSQFSADCGEMEIGQ